KYIEPTTASVNATVLSLGALSFSTGYNTHDWSGVLEAVTLNTSGTVNQVLWKDGFDKNLPSPASIIDTSYHSAAGAAGRTDVWTDSYTVSSGVGTLTPFQFDTANANSLDSTENSAGQGLQSPALAGAKDTVDHRILYLLGDNTYELTGLYRTRSSILGAILRSEPLYVAGATGNYFDSWPNNPDGTVAAEAASGAQHFDDFVTQQAKQPGMVYVGANDGMLHAFYAPVPQCSSGAVDPTTGNCSSYTFGTGTNPGVEAWAFIPRAVYANLGNLTLAANFSFRPTVDAAPVRRDVFFANNWHTILAGGVGLGGRGVYALDVTNAGSFSAANVLWEFDSDMIIPAGCTSIQGSGADSIGCRATDLGYTVSQPNIARLNTGKWAVLVPNGYFPDCSAANGDIPTADTASCNVVAHQAPIDASGNPYSALFVLDAESGKVIAELKTPSGIPAIDGSGTVTSFGLATPVMGDYQGDQVDDVAFAGDVEGNLWRFDLSDPSPANWTVTLVYQGLFVTDASGTHQGVQPITTMPRLFPDPVTNRFMVVFGTGKFLGVGDNSNATAQALIAVRDIPGKTYDQTTGLTQQYLHESTAASGPYAGLSLRCVTGGAGDTCSTATPVTTVPGSGTGSGGWYINLSTTTSGGTINDAGERVVVNPGAIFASNTVVFETLITGSQTSDACNPAMQGSILALSATTGASAGVSALGGGQIAGARITNARTSGSLPLVSALGGGQSYIPGSSLAPSGKSPMSIDAPIWRRRSWQEIQQNQ
ncbi:MAG: pilus assembly protein, partial [Rhodanobacteraceae bacterium]